MDTQATNWSDLLFIGVPGYLTGLGTLVLAYATFRSVRQSQSDRREYIEEQASRHASRVNVDPVTIEVANGRLRARTTITNRAPVRASQVALLWRIDKGESTRRFSVRDGNRDIEREVIGGIAADSQVTPEGLDLPFEQGMKVSAVLQFRMSGHDWQLVVSSGELLAMEHKPSGPPVVYFEVINRYGKDGREYDGISARPFGRRPPVIIAREHIDDD